MQAAPPPARPPRLRLVAVADAGALAAALAAEIRGQVRATPTGAIVLAGGRTPRRAYQLVADPAEADRFARIEIFFGDERCVPPDHPDSNHRMVSQAWFGPAGLPAGRIHRIEGERPAIEAAARADVALRAVLGPRPRPDLGLLGLGADGHTASLFG